MKKNKNIPLIILVILLGTFSFWFVINKRGGTIKESLKNFAIEDTASITKIFLADKSGKQVTLDKIKPGEWRVNNKYYVRNDAVNLLLYTMKNVKVKEPVRKKARENAIKQLSVIATKMEAYSGEKLVKQYYIGNETQDQTGTYMLMVDEDGENSAYPFITYIPGFEGYLTTRYFTIENEWRDRSIFRYRPDEIASITMEFPSKPAESYIITQKNLGDFELRSLANNEVHSVDPIAVKQYFSYFRDIQFETVVLEMKEEKRDSILASQPINIMTVTDNKGKANSIKCFSKATQKGQEDVDGKPAPYDLDRFYGLVNGGKDFVICQYFVFGKLMQDKTYFSKQQKVVKK